MKLIGFFFGCLAIACIRLTNAESSITFDEIYNILQPLKDQLDKNSTDFDDAIAEGADGYIAFNISPDREIKTLSYPTLPKTLPPQFFITTVLKPDPAEGFLFAVLDPAEMIIQLGVELTPAGTDETNVDLLYTNATAHTSSQTIASLPAAHLAQQWSSMTIAVEKDEVSLYINCMKMSSQIAKRQPAELAFKEDSLLRLGRADPSQKTFQHQPPPSFPQFAYHSHARRVALSVREAATGSFSKCNIRLKPPRVRPHTPTH